MSRAEHEEDLCCIEEPSACGAHRGGKVWGTQQGEAAAPLLGISSPAEWSEGKAFSSFETFRDFKPLFHT